MSEKVYPRLHHHPDGLDTRLKEINSFDDSMKYKILETFDNHEAKKYKKKSKTNKLKNGLIQSIDGVLVLGLSLSCITLSVTGVRLLVVVAIASGIGAGVCIFLKHFVEYLEREEQHNL